MQQSFEGKGMDPGNAAARVGANPIVVELDEILVGGDLFLQSAFVHLGRGPANVLHLLREAVRGRPAIEAYCAKLRALDISYLPFNEGMLERVRQAVTAGGAVYLASTGVEHEAIAIANHLGLFAGVVVAGEGGARSKAALQRHLADRFGERGYEYLEPSDAPVRADLDAKARSWIRLFRLHQWAKNLLLFVPLVTAHQFELLAVSKAVVAFLAFSFAASGIYVVNDLVDIDADRKHPRKRNRPIAAGAIRASHALFAAIVLIIVAMIAAISIGSAFAIALAAYLFLTTGYSLVLKRKMLVDVITLAALYTIRVVAGAAAISVPLSEWLLGFSMFVFMALALIKRYVELSTLLDGDLPDPSNRNYRKADLNIVAALTASASFNAVTVFALYISSEAGHQLYRHPHNLWLICPILMYWLGRALMLAHRRELDDDPIVFALKDRNSLVCFALAGASVLSAI
jgi:4-hydroxybenzoate polyprenyltransferase